MRLNRQLCTTFVCRAAIKTSFVMVIGYWLHLVLGAIWPQPKTQVSSDNFLTVHPTNFDFESAGFSCDLLKNALARYKHLITSQLRRAKTRNAKHDDNWRRVSENAGNLDKLKVDLLSKCEKMPYLGMDESCESLHSIIGRWSLNKFFLFQINSLFQSRNSIFKRILFGESFVALNLSLNFSMCRQTRNRWEI